MQSCFSCLKAWIALLTSIFYIYSLGIFPSRIPIVKISLTSGFETASCDCVWLTTMLSCWSSLAFSSSALSQELEWGSSGLFYTSIVLRLNEIFFSILTFLFAGVYCFRQADGKRTPITSMNFQGVSFSGSSFCKGSRYMLIIDANS